jgi:catechol 2,3-dioxygenase-like lactoylglutathione lyase family enzyme
VNSLSLPGAVRQIGYVVTDIDAAIDAWVRIGIGPWYVMRELPQRTLYRGEPCELVQSIAMANSGALQIELIQQHGDTPSIFTEFLTKRGEGFHQLAWWVEDFDAAVRAAEAAGFPVVWAGAEEGSVPFVYVEPPEGPVAVIEIMELNEITKGMDALVRGASEGWDGTDPVRSLMG